MALENRPQAFADLVKGYLRAADLAERRRRHMLKIGDPVSAALWGRADKYFSDLAVQTAKDDIWIASLQGEIERRREDRQLTEWTLAAIELTLGYLSGTQRVCYELVEGGPVDVREVAAALSIAPSQVRQHVMRARQTLKRVRDSVAHLVPPRRLWYLQRQAS